MEIQPGVPEATFRARPIRRTEGSLWITPLVRRTGRRQDDRVASEDSDATEAPTERQWWRSNWWQVVIAVSFFGAVALADWLLNRSLTYAIVLAVAIPLGLVAGVSRRAWRRRSGRV